MKLALACLLACGLLQGTHRDFPDFDDIVRAVSDQLHARPLSIPFFGLISFAISAAHPAGVKRLHLAVWENTGRYSDLEEILRSANPSWRPFVRVRGHGETTLIYLAGEGRDCKMFIATQEPSELTLVQVKVNPETLQAILRDPKKSTE
jgi:hypothetical protein